MVCDEDWSVISFENNSSWFLWPLETLIDTFLIFDESQAILKGVCFCVDEYDKYCSGNIAVWIIGQK